jgi:hypothetical protein
MEELQNCCVLADAAEPKRRTHTKALITFSLWIWMVLARPNGITRDREKNEKRTCMHIQGLLLRAHMELKQ